MSFPSSSQELTITPFSENGVASDDLVARIAEASCEPAIRDMSVISMTWVDNLAAQVLLRSRGYKHEVILYELSPHRVAS